MKNISRHLFMALTAVCAAALVVFLIQLIVINSGEEPKEPESIISGIIPDQDADDLTDADNPFGEGGIAAYEPPATQRPPPQGTPHEIRVDDNTVLTIYAQDALFDYVRNDLNWRFEYRGGGSAALEICFWALTAQGMGADAEAFMNSRAGGGNADYKGSQPVIDSDITAHSVTAQNGGITYEAWLYRLPGSELAIVLMVNYEFDNQRDDLYTVLSSLSIDSAAG